ncbi:MAG: heat-inducible transcription repressor HrcA [Firmicutes bacterium]|nr:heat-inducible transcription repressor HrcA [Bacillota bacterium]
MKHTLDERKQTILLAITRDYISTADPVGSRTIARRYELGISPATIRNEMADLEEMGYLEQPHTSAGRIPSQKGYRFYVDRLMEHERLAEGEQTAIREALEVKAREIEQVIHQAVRIISDLTSCAAVVLLPEISRGRIHTLRLLPVEPGRALLVMISSSGMITNRILPIPSQVSENDLQWISGYLTERLKGLTLLDLDEHLITAILEELRGYSAFSRQLLEALVRSVQQADGGKVITGGATNILSQPEFRDIEKARDVISIFERSHDLSQLLFASRPLGVKITIGNENVLAELRACSLVSAVYFVGGLPSGALGVVGPTRMNYARVISIVEYVARMINDCFDDPF